MKNAFMFALEAEYCSARRSPAESKLRHMLHHQARCQYEQVLSFSFIVPFAFSELTLHLFALYADFKGVTIQKYKEGT